MKRSLAFLFFLFNFFVSTANNRDSVINYALPDSVKAVSFMAEITVNGFIKKKYCAAGITTDAVTLSLEKYPIGSLISFSTNATQTIPVANGLKVSLPDRKFPFLLFHFDWEIGETYKLLISQATDSVGNFSLYSGYIFLPKEMKWKLIGTVKIEGRWNTIQKPAFFYINGKKQNLSVTPGQVWCQRQNGSWKNMLQKDLAPPVVNLYSHVDSLEQLQIDKKIITQAIAENKTDANQDHEGVYYTILKEGTGRQVSINDTVIAYYKGYLLKDGSIFDQTKEKPATFPLKRLIMGWQIGVPLCKVGGKIKIIIPSNLAYSIRTRGAKIPPNSILVFEIEVVDAKAPQ
jgi:FKBP-type peptidyl-prolyl cis-trans isomerase FkpA